MDNILSFIYAFLGLSYTILAGKGKFICFIFGILSSGLYSFLSFKQGYYGSFALNFFYYVPIQILSLYKWQKNTDKIKKTVNKISLGKKEFIKLIIFALILSLLLLAFFCLIKDKSPFLDSFITIFSILGAYLTLKRAIEQWYVWSFVNLTTLIMWAMAFFNGESVLGIMVLWFIYLILGIHFYFEWKKEVQ